MSQLLIGSQSYEDERKARKLGFYQSIIFVLKTMLGVGMFAIPVGFSKVGYILGIIICIVSCYTTTYGMYKLIQISKEIEEQHNVKIENYHDLPEYCVNDNAKRSFKYLIILSNSFVNVGVIVAISVYLISFFSEMFKINILFAKLGFT